MYNVRQFSILKCHEESRFLPMRPKPVCNNPPISRTTKHSAQKSEINPGVKSQRTVYPLQLGVDGPLRVQLQGKLSALRESSSASLSFSNIQYKNDIDLIVAKLKSINEEDGRSEVYKNRVIERANELTDIYFSSGLYIDRILEEKFKKSINQAEKEVILDLLIISGGGYSDFIDRCLKTGENNPTYSFCIGYLMKLDDEEKHNFITSSWVDNPLLKKGQNLAKALVLAFGEDSVIGELEKYFKESVKFFDPESGNITSEPDDEQTDYLQEDYASYGDLVLNEDDESFEDIQTSVDTDIEKEQLMNAVLEDLSDRQKVFLAILNNSDKNRKGEAERLLNFATSWEIVSYAFDTAIKSFKKDKEKVNQFVLSFLKNENYRPILRGTALNDYVFKNGKKAIENILLLVKDSDSPILGLYFVVTMLMLGEKEGKDAIRTLISDDIQKQKKSPALLYLFHKAGSIGSSDGILLQKDVRRIVKGILSLEVDVADFIQMHINSNTFITRGIDPFWTLYKLVKPSFKDIVGEIGIERFVSWMIYDSNPNVRRNTRNLFQKALQEKNPEVFNKKYDEEKKDTKGVDFDKSFDEFLKKSKNKKLRIASDLVDLLNSI